jgi:hypothetical protein
MRHIGRVECGRGASRSIRATAPELPEAVRIVPSMGPIFVHTETTVVLGSMWANCGPGLGAGSTRNDDDELYFPFPTLSHQVRALQQGDGMQSVRRRFQLEVPCERSFHPPRTASTAVRRLASRCQKVRIRKDVGVNLKFHVC